MTCSDRPRTSRSGVVEWYTWAMHYLDTPSMGLPTPETVSAITAALTTWQEGAAHYGAWEETMERCRELFAQLVDVSAGSVGLLSSIVPAVAAVADSLSDRGGTVVAHRDEFRSLLLPVLATIPEDRIRWVDGAYSAESFVQHIDTQTSAVFVSSVASHDGARPALEVIRDACRAVDAALVVDATQSLGIVPLGIPAADVDLLAGAGYKGLRGPRGAAYAFAREGVVTRVRAASPYGVRDGAAKGGYGPPYLPKDGAQALDQSPAWLSWSEQKVDCERRWSQDEPTRPSGCSPIPNTCAQSSSHGTSRRKQRICQARSSPSRRTPQAS